MSAFIVSQAFTDLIISTMVEQKYYGSKESQEKYLESILKTREEFYRLKGKFPNEVENIHVQSTERLLNNAVEFIQDCLK
jgi:hypothetical protein